MHGGCKSQESNSKPYGVPADWEFYVDSIWINMKVPSTGAEGGRPTTQGG